MVDRRRLLSDDEIDAALAETDGWRREDDRIVRQWRFTDFVQAFAFMTSVALVAEQLNHHPEWSNVYGTVTIELTNHDAGGVTKLDLHMAALIDQRAML